MSNTLSSNGDVALGAGYWSGIEADYHTLTVTLAGTGSGIISSDPTGIECGVTCTASYDEGTVVTLTAADRNSASIGWTGTCSGTGDCIVTMTEARSVTATFDLEFKIYLLIVANHQE